MPKGDRKRKVRGRLEGSSEGDRKVERKGDRKVDRKAGIGYGEYRVPFPSFPWLRNIGVKKISRLNQC